MTVEGLPFSIIDLDLRAGKIGGSVSQPEKWSTTDGRSFTQVGPGNSTRPIASPTLSGNRLQFITKNPKDPSDEDEYELTLIDADHASLDLGTPFPPWSLSRARALVALPAKWDTGRSYSIEPSHPPSPEMAAIFDAIKVPVIQYLDQQWKAISKDDASRRTTHGLLDAGKLQAGEDFPQVAFIFQHGDTSDDYLLRILPWSRCKGDMMPGGSPPCLWIARTPSEGRKSTEGTST
jgi:hypothetical protein